MSETAKLLGWRIRRLRTERATPWTQEDVAKRAGISVSYLSMIERGQRLPHLETLVSLAHALDVPLSELFAGIGGERSGAPDLIRPLRDFCRTRRLTSRDVEKLLAAAQAMFDRKG